MLTLPEHLASPWIILGFMYFPVSCLCVSIDFVNVPGLSVLIAPLVHFLGYTYHALYVHVFYYKLFKIHILLEIAV